MGEFLTKEKLLSVRSHKHFNLGLTVLIILLVVDLLLLNVKILFPENKIVNDIFQEKSNEAPKLQSIEASSSDSCGQTCMAEINKAVSAVASVGKSSTAAANSYVKAPGKQEYFIPLGSATISNTTIATITGMQATVDGSAYGNNYSATFEVTVNIPTGNETATFQLYNATANHPVWNSVVNFTTGGTPALLISSPIKLDPGNNTYVVQGATQLTYPANITQARIHIITQ